MRMKRSTQSIVKGSLFKTAFQKKQPTNGEEEIEKRNAEISMARNRLLIFTAVFAIAVMLVIVLVLLLGRSSSSAIPTKPELSADEKMLVIPAGNALLETIEAGDIVQFYTANGSIGSIRHVLVYSVGADGFTVAMTEQQLCDYLNAMEDGYVTVLPLIIGNKRAAEAALEQQRAWNAPEITLSVLPSQSVVEAGGTVQLKTQMTVTPEGATVPDIVWSSSDEAIASVDGDGVVHAMLPGKVLITASCGEEMASCTLSVMIYNTELHFDAESHDMEIGETLQLTLQATPENANEQLSWTSSDHNVVTVSADGLLTALAGGEATITATGKNTETSVTIRIKVPASSVVLNSSELQLTVGSSGQLAAVVMPENASDKTVAWTSSDSAIAAVNADGTVQALAAGSVTVTATCGDATASCTVTVSPAPSPQP